MPMHDWTKVDSYIFHDFHTCLIVALTKGLNRLLPETDFAIIERALNVSVEPDRHLAEPDDRMSIGFKQKRIAIRHRTNDHLVAIVEIISSGNKSSRKEWRRFVYKATAALQNSVHVFIVDPFPPTSIHPRGTHDAIWSNLGGKRYTPPAEQPLTYASYESSDTFSQEFRCFVQPGRPGESLPEVPLFLEPERFINVPLEELYSDAMKYVLPQHLALLEA